MENVIYLHIFTIFLQLKYLHINYKKCEGPVLYYKKKPKEEMI